LLNWVFKDINLKKGSLDISYNPSVGRNP
jgi:hypothetical protein